MSQRSSQRVKAQASLSYLLLIGGAIVISIGVMVIVVGLSESGGESAGDLLQVYNQQLKDTIKDVYSDEGNNVIEDDDEVICNENELCELSRGENAWNCSFDCVCGDLICSPGEDPGSCPVDCGTCGDGICQDNEKIDSCPADCDLPPEEGPDYGDGIPDAC
ncbi:MAG: hypothetical protein ABH821_02600 [archaeon]